MHINILKIAKERVIASVPVGTATLAQFYNLKCLNIGIIDATFSPIIGQKEGNIEFLFYLKNNFSSKSINYENLVNEAVKVLKVK